jgi:hypothetical protein
VNFARNSKLQSWKPTDGIKDCLMAMKEEMIANKKSAQPGEGEMY